MYQIIVDLNISVDKYLAHYQGAARNVFCHSRDGRSVSFPSSLLQPFLLHNGIRGSFRITFDSQGKFQNIERL